MESDIDSFESRVKRPSETPIVIQIANMPNRTALKTEQLVPLKVVGVEITRSHLWASSSPLIALVVVK